MPRRTSRDKLNQTGFSNTEHFSHAYEQHFGIVRSHDRWAGRVPFQLRSFPGHGGV